MADQTYTLAQAATVLGVREDDLGALLSTAGIDLTGQIVPTLTQPELDRLSGLIGDFHVLHAEGPFEGIDE